MTHRVDSMRQSAVLIFAVAGTAFTAAADDVSFSREIAPVLVQKCQGCHNDRKSKGGYRVDTFQALTRPGDNGEAPLTPGHPERSALFRLISTADEKKRMPQKDDPLPPAQVSLVEKWIREGARFDGADPTSPLSTLGPSSNPTAPHVYPRRVPILSLAFSPDGGLLAAGGYHEVTVWDRATGKLAKRLGRLPQQTQSLAWLPDGSAVVAACGTPGALGELWILPTDGTRRPRVLDRTPDMMLCVAVSPEGKRVAAGGTDGMVRVFDASTGRRLLLVEPHADWVTAVAFSPDGKRLATASRDKSARVFDAATGEAQSAYLGHAEPLYALAWDSGGQRLYTGGRDREIHVWEPLAEGKKVGEIKGFEGDVLRVLVAGDSLYSSSSDGKVRKHSTAKRELVQTYAGSSEWAYALALTKDGNTLSTGDFAGSVRIYDPDKPEPTTTFVAAPGR